MADPKRLIYGNYGRFVAEVDKTRARLAPEIQTMAERFQVNPQKIEAILNNRYKYFMLYLPKVAPDQVDEEWQKVLAEGDKI